MKVTTFLLNSDSLTLLRRRRRIHFSETSHISEDGDKEAHTEGKVINNVTINFKTHLTLKKVSWRSKLKAKSKSSLRPANYVGNCKKSFQSWSRILM
jgi:hypothetical protein